MSSPAWFRRRAGVRGRMVERRRRRDGGWAMFYETWRVGEPLPTPWVVWVPGTRSVTRL